MYTKNIGKKLTAIACLCSLVLSSATYTQAFGEKKVNGEYSVSADQAKGSEYTNWKKDFDREDYSAVANVVLTPGSSIHDLNVSWYAKEYNTSPAIAFSKDETMSDKKIFNGSSKKIARSTGNTTYYSTNQIDIKDYFEEGQTYYYQTTNNSNATEPVWSEVHSYQVGNADNYSVLLYGDAQIGASGNHIADSYSWEKTVNQSLKTVPNPAFMISLGDQVDYKTGSGDNGLREQQYAGLLRPDALRSVPFVTLIGNHDSKGADYSYHFNNPNTDGAYGKTEAGCDYYFSRGNALFIVLNSNNRNQKSHRKLMKKAIASHKDAKWRIVAFHHDIYGSGSFHSNKTSANMRIIMAPLMDEFDIDLVFSGHDHCFTRSHSMYDGTAIASSESTNLTTWGTTYVALGATGGGKMYALQSKKQYFVAERSNDLKNTYSTLNISENKLILKTYDHNGKAYAKDVVLTKTSKKVNPGKIYKTAKELKKSKYTKKSYAKLEKALKNYKKVMEPTKKDPAINKLQNNYLKKKDPLTYYGYATGTKKALKKGYSTLLNKTLYTKKHKTKWSTVTSLVNKIKKAQKGLKKK